MKVNNALRKKLKKEWTLQTKMNTGLYTTRKQVGIGAQLKLIKTSEDSQGGAENHKGEKLQLKNTLKVKQEVTGWPRGEEKGTQEGERDLQGNSWGDGYEIKAGTTLKIIKLIIYQDRKRKKKPPKQNKNWNIISKYINRNLKHKTHDIQVNQILCKPSVLHKMTTASGISL